MIIFGYDLSNHKHSVNMSELDLMKYLLALLANGNLQATDELEKVGPGVHIWLAQQYMKDPDNPIVLSRETSFSLGRRDRALDPQPQIEIMNREDSRGDWLIVRWQYTVGDVNPNGPRFGWRFARQSSAFDYNYQIISDETMAQTSINERGDISIDFHGRKTIFPAFEESWPWVLLAPKNYGPLGLLRDFLKGSDANPLSDILHSPQPYKTMGKQIADELNLIKKAIEESLVL
jgi:hypothetical protein